MQLHGDSAAKGSMMRNSAAVEDVSSGPSGPGTRTSEENWSQVGSRLPKMSQSRAPSSEAHLIAPTLSTIQHACFRQHTSRFIDTHHEPLPLTGAEISCHMMVACSTQPLLQAAQDTETLATMQLDSRGTGRPRIPLRFHAANHSHV